ncbi:hypothetical protein PHET_02609 [Paragonimus heterotremus]|uniref:Uncharacterized protein n=1 Tax=Paragonimus heterotremus TaxID=100268 RepID=A0A8J4T414_9TREM|nr:hypothetical protein PHET_02609 [Paragonimus heterotremus]
MLRPRIKLHNCTDLPRHVAVSILSVGTILVLFQLYRENGSRCSTQITLPYTPHSSKSWMTGILNNDANHKMKNELHKKKREPSVIHLSLMIGGARSTLQAVTLMKSLLYHHASPQMDTFNNTRLEVSSNGAISQLYQHLHLHLIVERMSYQRTRSMDTHEPLFQYLWTCKDNTNGNFTAKPRKG